MGHEERDKAIVREYASGETMVAVGKRHGVSRERVRQILVRHGYSERERKKRGLPLARAARKADRTQRAVEMAIDGLSSEDIAKNLGVNPTTASAYLRKAGLARGRNWGNRRLTLTDEQTEQVLSVYAEGVSGLETAKRTGVGQHHVFRLLHERGVVRHRGRQKQTVE